MSKERGFPEIGKRLLAIRGERDQRGFSRGVNVSQQAVSNYERGNLPASWAFLRCMNEDFNVNLNWLITGQGQRDHRVGSPYASLADNRAPGWPRTFLEQVAFEAGDALEILVNLYFLYLATEPADAKTRLMSDVQAIVEAARQALEERGGFEEDSRVLFDVYDALARDDRRSALGALLEAGERLESVERNRAMPRARKLYLAALGLARLQGWPEQEMEAARRVGRSYRKEGLWQEADRFFKLAIDAFEREDRREGIESSEPDAADAKAAGRARSFLGYGHIAKMTGDLPAARERYLSALAWALKTQDPKLRGEVYVDLACLAYREQQWQKALEYVATGTSFAEEAQDRKTLHYLNLTEALVLRERGRPEDARPILARLLSQAEAQDELDAVSLASGNLAEVLLDLGRIEEARRLLERTDAAAEAHGNPHSIALRKFLRARIEAARGEDGAARAQLLECLRYAGEKGLASEFGRAAAALDSSSGPVRFPSAATAG